MASGRQPCLASRSEGRNEHAAKRVTLKGAALRRDPPQGQGRPTKLAHHRRAHVCWRSSPSRRRPWAKSKARRLQDKIQVPRSHGVQSLMGTWGSFTPVQEGRLRNSGPGPG